MRLRGFLCDCLYEICLYTYLHYGEWTLSLVLTTTIMQVNWIRIRNANIIIICKCFVSPQEPIISANQQVLHYQNDNNNK